MTEHRDEATAPSSGNWLGVVIAWILVGVPLLWGVLSTLRKGLALFEK